MWRGIAYGVRGGHGFPTERFRSLAFFTNLYVNVAPITRTLTTRKRAGTSSALIIRTSAPSLCTPRRSTSPGFSHPMTSAAHAVAIVSRRIVGSRNTAGLASTLGGIPNINTFFTNRGNGSAANSTVCVHNTSASGDVCVSNVHSVNDISHSAFGARRIRIVGKPSNASCKHDTPANSVGVVDGRPHGSSNVSTSTDVNDT